MSRSYDKRFNKSRREIIWRFERQFKVDRWYGGNLVPTDQHTADEIQLYHHAITGTNQYGTVSKWIRTYINRRRRHLYKIQLNKQLKMTEDVAIGLTDIPLSIKDVDWYR